MDGQMSIFDFFDNPNNHVCETCQFSRHYTSGLGEVYHGTCCVKNAPFAVDVDAERKSCEDWRKKEQEDSK